MPPDTGGAGEAGVLAKMPGRYAPSPKPVDAGSVASAMSNQLSARTDSRGFEPKNRLLSALPDWDLLSLQPHLEAVPLARGSVLFEIDEPLRRLYFLETGVAALLTPLDNRAIGVAAVGREGAVDVQNLLLGRGTALGQCQVLVPGSALAVEGTPFLRALRKSPKIRAACEAYARALLVQMLQAVPCNRLHSLERRCARWLLMCADRTEGDTFELTKESLAEMLGVPQSTVTAMVSTLRRDGVLWYRRSAITVVDRRRLETAACECYRIVRDRSERLLALPSN
jgi:CRP-like cAMP-binding protein